MTRLAQIQEAISGLSLDEMNAFEAWWRSQHGRPGARLTKLVAEAWAGNPAVPRQVTLVSDQPLTERAVTRSRELIQERGWDV